MKNLKDKLYVLATLVVIGLTIWAIIYKNKDDNSEIQLFDNNEQINEAEDNLNNSDTTSIDDGSSGNFIDGILTISDDQNKGNFKISSKAGEVYLRTNKDFSSFIGSEVVVTFDGTIENFILIDIQRKVENNGFINVQ